MQIEIAEPGRMTQTGSSLMRLIQNNNMPVLDLLVRESIQNSLDARKSNSKYVEVDFLTGNFSGEKLSSELECITNALSNRYADKHNSFIAIRDTNTVGLTGVMDYKKVKDNIYGNLLKLVYEICKPQEIEGSGGSWGIGKTVYFRIGIGLVIYYSRIINDDGQYESRLAASLVENEASENAMIPEYKGLSRRGIAWWGKSVGENETQPVTDEEYISEFLDIFSIKEYEGDETGTTIIIPFINEEELLSNNRIEYLNDQEQPITPFWCNHIEDYLSIAAQRWYAPRLNNVHYMQGAYLKLKINDKGLSFDAMEPVFKVVQALYNRAGYVEEEDILSNVIDKKVEPINLRKYLTDSTVGVLSFAKVDRALLCMNAPDNKPEPFMYFNNEMRDTEVNKPTVCFTRKPAMIVSYENVGAWVSNISPSSKNEYIIGIFVLNSFNKLKNSPSNSLLEEYFRKSEMADHTSWSDWSDGSYNPRFVSKIQSNVTKIIGKEYATENETDTPKVNSGLGKLFGDMLLPPENFDTKPSLDPKPPVHDVLSKKSRFKFAIDLTGVRYEADQMIVPIVLETSSKKKIKKAAFDVLIDSDTKKIAIDEWESKMGLIHPFYIKEYKISIDAIDGEKVGAYKILQADSKTEINGIEYSGKVTSMGSGYGLNIISEEPHCIKMRIETVIVSTHRDVKPAFHFEKEV